MSSSETPPSRRPTESRSQHLLRDRRWLAFPLVFALSIGSLILWRALLTDADRHLQRRCDVGVVNITQRVEAEVNASVGVLVRMAHRWEVRGAEIQTLENEWKSDTSQYIRDYRGYQAIEWVDSSFHVRSVVPLKGNEEVVNRDLGFEPLRREAFETAKSRRVPILTRSVDLIQGGVGFLTIVPMFAKDEPLGFIVGGYRATVFFPPLIPADILREYDLSIHEGDRLLYSSRVSQSHQPQREQRQADLKVFGTTWRLLVGPTAASIAQSQSRLPAVALAIGLLIAVMTGGMFFYWQSAQLAASALEHSNALLQASKDEAVSRSAEVQRANQDLEQQRSAMKTLVEDLKRSRDELQQQNKAMLIVLGDLQLSEESLKASEAQLTTAQQIAQTGSYVWDLESNQVRWSTEMYRIYGFSPPKHHAPLEGGVREHTHPEDRAALQALTAAALRDRQPFEQEFRIVRDSGEVRVVHAKGQPIFDAEGHAFQIQGTVQDITERKRGEETLIDSERRLGLALDSAQLGSWDLNLVNDTAVRTLRHDQIFGYTELQPQWGAQIFSSHVLPEDRPGAQRCFEVAFLSGNFHMECRIKWPDQSVHWIVADGRVIRDETGKPIRMLGVVQDITDRKQADLELARKAEELERSNDELEQFAYAASHDLKAPLRAIDQLAQWIEEDIGEQLKSEAKERLTLLRGRVRRMERLLSDLLEYARVGRVGTEAELVDIARLVPDIVEMADVPPGFAIEVIKPLPRLLTAVAPLKRVLMNLIGNAIKHHHHRDTGRIRISASEVGEFYEFTVADDGPGIPERFREKAFQMFQTLKSRDEVEGSGMGLAMVKKTVEVFGGKVTLKSNIGQGSVFSFTWPKKFEKQP